MVKIYTGIGSRSAPKWALNAAYALGISLAKLGFTLRSGGADGMDASFEKGCDKGYGKKEIYLPWRNFNNNPSPLYKITDEGMSAAELVHPNWHNLSQAVKKLHTRNVYQITGYDLSTYSRFVICYTPWDKGGTLQALRIAQELDIEIYNLYDFDSSLWDTTTSIGINEIIDVILKDALIYKYKLQSIERPKKIITEFVGEHHFLSNFYMSEFIYKDKKYFFVENAYQSYKTKPPSERIRVAGNPGTAKRLGQSVKLRSDWESIKDNLMYELVTAKFEDDEDLKEQLIATDDTYLVEGNHWHDNYWGDCHCHKCATIKGENKLGQILMRVREDLINKKDQLFYCKLFNDYQTDGKCTKMSCEFCDRYYDEDRKRWWYHENSNSYFLASLNEIKNDPLGYDEFINVDDKIKTRVVNVKTDTYDVYCGRSSKWGNPFIIGQHGDRTEVIDKYRSYFMNNEELKSEALKLHGMKLGCFCAPKDCHVEVIAEFIENFYH